MDHQGWVSKVSGDGGLGQFADAVRQTVTSNLRADALDDVKRVGLTSLGVGAAGAGAAGLYNMFKRNNRKRKTYSSPLVLPYPVAEKTAANVRVNNLPDATGPKPPAFGRPGPHDVPIGYERQAGGKTRPGMGTSTQYPRRPGSAVGGGTAGLVASRDMARQEAAPRPRQFVVGSRGAQPIFDAEMVPTPRPKPQSRPLPQPQWRQVPSRPPAGGFLQSMGRALARNPKAGGLALGAGLGAAGVGAAGAGYGAGQLAKRGSVADFLSGGSATTKAGIPWYGPAMLAAGMGGLAAGWKGVDSVLDHRRKRERGQELEAARQDFHDALMSQYDKPLAGVGPAKTAADAKPMEKVGAELDRLFDQFEKAAATLGDLGGQLTGGYGMYAGLAGLMTGALVYDKARKRQRRAILDKAMQRRDRRKFNVSPPEIQAVPEPFHPAPPAASPTE